MSRAKRVPPKGFEFTITSLVKWRAFCRELDMVGALGAPKVRVGDRVRVIELPDGTCAVQVKRP